MSLIIRPDGSERFIPFSLLRKQKTVSGQTVDGLASWTFPDKLLVESAYINTSLDPVQNWITRFFHDLQLTPVTEEERKAFLEEEEYSANGYNWEYYLRCQFTGIGGNFNKGAPLFKSEEDFTYTYSFSHVPTRGVHGVTDTVPPDVPLDVDLWEVNKAKVMEYLQLALDRKWPIKDFAERQPIALWNVQLGEQTTVGILMGISALMKREAALFRVNPVDPGFVKINGLTVDIVNDNQVDSAVGILKMGHGDTNPERVSYDPADWNSDVYAGTTGTTINNLPVKNYFWIYTDLSSWTVWDPTTVTGNHFLNEYKKVTSTVLSIPGFTREVTVKSFLVPRYNSSAQLLTWILYVIEYDKATEAVLKCWMATMNCRMSKYASPSGVYTVRYFAGSKDGVWTCQDVTNISNIKITISVPVL